VLATAKPAKDERAAVLSYFEADEPLPFRQPADAVGEAGGRTLLEVGTFVVVSDRKLLAASTSGGLPPQWEVFTLPDAQSAARLADALGIALRGYRRDRMGLDGA